MKKLIGIAVVALLSFGVAAYAQGPGYGWGPGMMGPGYGYGWGQGMGPGMMWGYVDKYLPGFSVERVLPFTGMPRTMYGVELKGPKGEVQYLRINPWGGVMPFAGGRWGANS